MKRRRRLESHNVLAAVQDSIAENRKVRLVIALRSLGDEMRQILLVFCGLLLVGCDDGTASVDGVVTFNSEPLNGGMIVLEPVDGKGPVAGANVEKGAFHIDGVLPGEKLIRIYASYPAGETANIDNPKEKIVRMEELLPEDWHNKSTRKLSVVAPVTQETFAITGKDPRKAEKKRGVNP
jgi:hypothetical protein